MERFAQQGKSCSEEGCGQAAVGKFMGKSVCKDHLTAFMGRATQEIPVADQGISQSQGTERIKYERFKQVLKDQIDQGSGRLMLDSINDQLQLMEKGSSKSASIADDASESDSEVIENLATQRESQDSSLACPTCGKMGVTQNHIDGCTSDKLAQSAPRCYICHAPVNREDAVQVTVGGRPALRHKNPAMCDEIEETAFYAEPDSVLEDNDALSIVSHIICAMCGDDWDTSVLDHNKVASLTDGQGCPTCDGAPLCMGCSHKFVAHAKGNCGAEEIRFDRRLATDVRDTCSCDGYLPLEISYYDEHLASKVIAGYPPKADDDIDIRGQDHPEDDEGGNDDFPGQDILEGVAHQQEHLRKYKSIKAHEVPFIFITDHLGELATGVEPATCGVCNERMEAHAQWAPTKQSKKNTSKWKGVFNFLASFGRGDVPETFITDHLGELATGVEPATCSVCGEAISRHAQWAPTKQKTAAAETEDDFFVNEDERCSECGGKGFSILEDTVHENPLWAFFRCDNEDCGALHYGISGKTESGHDSGEFWIHRVAPRYDGRADTDEDGVLLDIHDERRKQAANQWDPHKILPPQVEPEEERAPEATSKQQCDVCEGRGYLPCTYYDGNGPECDWDLDPDGAIPAAFWDALTDEGIDALMDNDNHRAAHLGLGCDECEGTGTISKQAAREAMPDAIAYESDGGNIFHTGCLDAVMELPKGDYLFSDDDFEPGECDVCGEEVKPMRRHASSEDSFVPPAEVAKNAERGLDLRKEHGRGGTEVGVARARDLSNRKGLSYDTVKRMKAYFDRHEVDKEGEGWGKDSAGYIAWLLWGGDSGRSWANKIVKQKDGDKKESSWRTALRTADSCRGCGSSDLNHPATFDKTGMSLCRSCGEFNPVVAARRDD